VVITTTYEVFLPHQGKTDYFLKAKDVFLVQHLLPTLIKEPLCLLMKIVNTP